MSAKGLAKVLVVGSREVSGKPLDEYANEVVALGSARTIVMQSAELVAEDVARLMLGEGYGRVTMEIVVARHAITDVNENVFKGLVHRRVE